MLSLGIGGVLAVVFFAIGLYHERRYRLLIDLPTLRPGAVFIGLVEVAGKTRCERPLTSTLTDARCVWYSYRVEEKWSRTVTTTSTDSQGRSRTHTRTESGWKTIATGGELINFDLVDESGSVRIDPEGATVTGECVMEAEVTRADPLYYGKGPREAVSNSDHRRRFVEHCIQPGAQVFVLGQARQRSDIVGAEIARDSQAPLFAISVHGEKSVQRRYFWVARIFLLLGLAAASVGTAYMQDGRFVGEGLVPGAGAYVVIWVVAWLLLVYNGLIELRQRVRQGWANIEVQLKRRHDLITRLVPIVAGLVSHEGRLQATVAALRTQLVATPPGQPGPDPALLSSQLRSAIEAYPDLAAQSGFAHLHQTLVDTEDRIAFARNYFNDITTSWNNRIARFPDVLVAMLTGQHRQMPLDLDAPAAATASPQVQWSRPSGS